MYYAIMVSGDKIPLTENDFINIRTRVQRSIERNVAIENGGYIQTKSIMYLGPELKANDKNKNK